jgi:hypothetical protein
MPWQEQRSPAEQEPAPGPDLLGGIEALLDIHIEACSISTNGALQAAPASDAVLRHASHSYQAAACGCLSSCRCHSVLTS